MDTKFAAAVVAALNDKFSAAHGSFALVRGKKYCKVVRLAAVDRESSMKVVEIPAGPKRELVPEQHSAQSVFLFCDGLGNVYKPAGYRAPAKGVRYSASTPDELYDLITEKADPFGRFLYETEASK